MSDFFKIFLASITAIFATIFVFGLLSFLSFIFIMVSLTNESGINVKENSVLLIETEKIGGDNIDGSPLEYMDFNTMEINKPISTPRLISTIEKAINDDNIEAIMIKYDVQSSLGLGQIEEIRSTLEKFKKSGKRVYFSSTVFSNTNYYLASVADVIISNPKGYFFWNGLTSQYMFFGDMLNNLDVKYTAIKHGKYKSAVEPFTLNKMSDASKEQNTKLLGSIWETLTQKVSESRNISVEKLNSLADNLSIYSAESGYKHGLIDTLMYADQQKDFLKNEIDENYHYITASKYVDAKTKAQIDKKESDNKIAVIYVEGTIIDGKSGNGNAGDESICKLIEEARKDDDTKGVVLRVNSPGGSVTASENICRKIELLQKEKPVIASFGNYAASGGYYVASLADVIVSQPNTITGSIGVFMMKIDVSKSLKNNLGINIETISTNKNSNFMSPLSGLNRNEEIMLQKSVDETYLTFLGHVSKGRNLSIEEVDNIAQGRVWSGKDAIKIGLVDGIGTLNDAIQLTAERCGLGDDYTSYEVYNEPSSFFEFITASTSVKTMLMGSKVEKFAGKSLMKQVEHLTSILENNKNIQATIPYAIVVE
ncbi:MAG: signal peptide peptidase SppA [Bacteroidetes bacterium]|nr:signal peptide peptidase SppA [Bacteroidota bacterium]